MLLHLMSRIREENARLENRNGFAIKHKNYYRTLTKPWKSGGAKVQRPIMSVMFNCELIE